MRYRAEFYPSKYCECDTIYHICIIDIIIINVIVVLNRDLNILTCTLCYDAEHVKIILLFCKTQNLVISLAIQN